MNNQIFWLATYPKSGNTLLRSMLISLFFTKDGIFELKKAYQIEQFERTKHLERNKELFNNEFDKLRNIPTIYKYLDQLQSKKSLGLNQDFVFFKTHSGLFNIGENPFTTEVNSRGIIYLVRDPRDVSLSWSRHSGISIDESIKYMTNDLANLYWQEPSSSPNVFNDYNRPRSLLSSWEKHVLSWTNIKWDIPILVIKFEDIVYDKINILNKIINFFETNYDLKFDNKEEKVDNIIKTTEFKKLQTQEKESGFLEATKNSRFFSVGQKDQWKISLSEDQIKLIEKKFSKVMKQFGYKLAVEF